MKDDRWFWSPPPRNASGHRISLAPGYRPIETRHLPWRWKLAEYPMRWLARSLSKTDDARLITGEERAPDPEDDWRHIAGSFAIWRETPADKSPE